MGSDLLKNKFDLKELEVNSLLEITQAINENLPEDKLYKIFHFTLLGNLKVQKLALFVKDEEWKCKVNFGIQKPISHKDLPVYFEGLNKIEKISDRSQKAGFGDFDYVLPIMHKKQLLGVVFITLPDPSSDSSNEQPKTTFIQTLSNIMMVAIQNKKLARRQLQQEAYRKEMEIAKGVQQMLFPKRLQDENGLRFAASYYPHDQVGGDYYDLIHLPDNKLLFCIADVSGKGVPAALIMSNFQASLRTLIRKSSDLTEVINELNFQIMNNSGGEHFITFFGALLYLKEGKMEYINAGHNPPLLFRKDGSYQALTQGTTILGALTDLPFINLGEVSTAEPFYLFSFTDGLTESFNNDMEAFGEDRICQSILPVLEEKPTFIHQKIMADLDGFKGHGTSQDDDITLFSFKYLW